MNVFVIILDCSNCALDNSASVVKLVTHKESDFSYNMTNSNQGNCCSFSFSFLRDSPQRATALERFGNGSTPHALRDAAWAQTCRTRLRDRPLKWTIDQRAHFYI